MTGSAKRWQIPFGVNATFEFYTREANIYDTGVSDGILGEDLMRWLRRGAFVAALAAFLMSWAHTAEASSYYFYGYVVQTGEHTQYCVSKPDGQEQPYPLRWWPPAGYSTASTWYKLGNSLSSSFKTACRAAEGNWEALWGGGTQWFHWYEDTTPITDQYNRAIGMSGLGSGVLGQCFWITENSWHPYQYNARVDRNVHELTRWYMRFQSDMSKLPVGAYWGTGDFVNCMDRESVATHEFGHIIPLMHPDPWDVNDADPQTMRSGYPYAGARTGTFARTPNGDDAFALLKLYPPIDQSD